jgi:hypothetical protein
MSLASQISGKVLVPGDEGYEESLKRWSAVAEKKAGYVALVESAEDISKTVHYPDLCFSLTKILWATENNLDLAIRGGGHSSSAASSTEGGVVGSSLISSFLIYSRPLEDARGQG